MRYESVLVLTLCCSACSETVATDHDPNGTGGGGGAGQATGGSSGWAAGAASGTSGSGSSGSAGNAGSAGGVPAGEVPGGEPEAGAIVGCENAERPARSLGGSAVEVCDATPPARCWYVAPNGNDDGAGSFSDPFRRPQTALHAVAPGDVVYLRGGVYGSEHSTVTAVVNWDDSSQGEIRRALEIGTISLPGWAGGETYGVSSGTADAPITVQSFPGERACLDGAGSIVIGSLSQETAYYEIRRITLTKGVIVMNGGSAGDNGEQINQTHHINVRESELFDYVEPTKENVGLVKVDRGDWGGPHDIFVRSNILHDLAVDQDGTIFDWQTTNDAQHFGAVTTLSRENYFGFEGGGTGYLRIENNVIYRTPSAFFFKNPMQGPIEIVNNRIRQVQAVGYNGAANVSLIGNLVEGVSVCWALVGNEVTYSDDTNTINGHNAVVEYNTFVGLEELMALRKGTGHTIRNNVFFGMTHAAAGANWDTGAYLLVTEHAADPLDPAASTLHKITSDENCFVTASDGFQFAARRIPPEITGSDWQLDHWSRTEAQALFGFDAGSTFLVEHDPAAVFVDPSAGNYALVDGSACAGKGHTAAP